MLCGGKINHSGGSFPAKECPACSDKEILFCIWLQETVWETVFSCQNAGILDVWGFMGITGPNILNYDSWKIQHERYRNDGNTLFFLRSLPGNT